MGIEGLPGGKLRAMTSRQHVVAVSRLRNRKARRAVGISRPQGHVKRNATKILRDIVVPGIQLIAALDDAHIGAISSLKDFGRLDRVTSFLKGHDHLTLESINPLTSYRHVKGAQLRLV